MKRDTGVGQGSYDGKKVQLSRPAFFAPCTVDSDTTSHAPCCPVSGASGLLLLVTGRQSWDDGVLSFNKKLIFLCLICPLNMSFGIVGLILKRR